jgi:hypothetical protein
MSNITTTETHPAWDNARNLLAGIKQALRISLAGQVLLGQELHTLKKDLGFRHGANKGGPSGQFVHTERTWSEWVKTELGVSYKTADRCIEMFEAAKARVKKIGVTGDLPGGSKKLALMFESRPSTMTDEDREKLQAVVERLVFGSSQADLLEELRLVKRHDTSGLGGETSAHHKDRPDLTVEQLSFTFLVPSFTDTRKLLLTPELPTYLVNLPLESDGDDELSLASLETQHRMMLDEILAAKANKIKSLKGAQASRSH